MSEMPIILHFLFAAFATVGFAIFFHAPARVLFPGGVTGGLGWMIYLYLFNLTGSTAFGGFVAGAFVSLCSEILARKLKQPAIVLVIPGILPLIPGIGLYNTMLFMIQKDYSMSVTKGTDAILLSAAIALGVLVITSLVKTIKVVNLRKIEQKRLMKLEKEASKQNSINPENNCKSENENDFEESPKEPSLEYEYYKINQNSESKVDFDEEVNIPDPQIEFDLNDLDSNKN